MGRNRIIIDDTKFIIYGFDGPCGGYFANYFNTEDEDYKMSGQPTEEVGFYPGVSKNRILEFFEKHNVVELAKEQTPDAFTNLILDLPC
jgi:hypothetical protein